MRSTMMNTQLTIPFLLRHGADNYPNSEVVTWQGETSRRAGYPEVAERIEKLAAALSRLGIGRDDRVGTFQWNNQEHQEAYLAIPSMGGILHTLNIRLAADQVSYIANHAEDKAVIVDASLVPLLARALPEMKTVEHVIVVGDADTSPLEQGAREVLSYQALLDAEEPGFAWPEIDEHDAAAMCYTSGTTGNPKGVVYSHRSCYLHAMAACMGDAFALTDADRVLPVVPMFHANSWGLAHAAWMAGADLLMPDRFLQPGPLAAFINAEKPTVSGAVPTVWAELLRHAEKEDVDFSAFRMVACGGAAVPLSLMQKFQEKHGVLIRQAWGMTETSPLAAVARAPKGTPPDDEWNWRAKAGRVFAGVEARIVDESGDPMPRDGKAVGEFEVRGPWVTESYYLDEDESKFHDGWLRTGDVGTLDQYGFMTISDRSKDVIKSGGEWISSVDLENTLMGHPDIAEAAVVAVPDEKWSERPLACVVPEEGKEIHPEDLRDFLGDKVAKFWVPERWAVIDAVPRTSVGKFDKKVLRARFAEGELDVQEIEHRHGT